MMQKAILLSIRRQLLTLVTGKKKLRTLATVILKKQLSNRILPLTVPTMNPRIDDRISTIGGAYQTLSAPAMKELVTDRASGGA